MTDDQKAAIDTFLRWLQIRAAESGTPGAEMEIIQLRADVHHSSLLARLLAGQEPHPFPPPRAFSYPNYALIETGREENCCVVLPAPHSLIPWPGIVINQSSQWTIEEKVSDEEYVVVYDRPKAGRWRLTKQPLRWENDDFCWRLERIETP